MAIIVSRMVAVETNLVEETVGGDLLEEVVEAEDKSDEAKVVMVAIDEEDII